MLVVCTVDGQAEAFLLRDFPIDACLCIALMIHHIRCRLVVLRLVIRRIIFLTFRQRWLVLDLRLFCTLSLP